MNFAKRAREIIRILEQNSFYAECPCCGETMLLKNAGLFYFDDFTSDAKRLYQKRLEEIKERERSIIESIEKSLQRSEVGAKAVNIGLILERIAPSMKEFCFNHNDCRSLFEPIDYIIFDGLNNNGFVNKILFVEIKTGSSRLSKIQKVIRDSVENKQVVWDTYEIEVNNEV